MSKYKNKIAVSLTDKQAKFIEEYAEKRDITKAEAIRVIIDVRRRAEVERELISNR